MGGGVAVLAAVIIAIVCCCKKRRSTNDTSPTNVDRAIGSVDGAVPNIPNARAFSAAEISKATDNFSKEIGKGAFGTVYYGKLPNGVEVAVKVLARDSTQGATEFSNEVLLVHHFLFLSTLHVNWMQMVCMIISMKCFCEYKLDINDLLSSS